MYDWLVGASLQHLYAYGFIAVIVVCLLEGMLIGQLLPYAFLVAAAAASHANSPVNVGVVFGGAVMASTVGQCSIYVMIRQYGRDRITDSCWIGVTESHLERSDRYFHKWGIRALILTNMIPFIRGTMVVPAAISDTSRTRFLIASVLGTVLFHGTIVILAVLVGVQLFS